MNDAALQPRTGARVLLLDPLGRVLLIHERIEGGTHWLTPGGGVEPGEDLAAAAARELYEEIGLRIELAADAAPVHQRRRIWHWRGASFDQTDNFFVVRVHERPAVAPAALTEMERQTLLATRWWSSAELRAVSNDVIEPPDLADVLDRLARPVHPDASSA